MAHNLCENSNNHLNSRTTTKLGRGRGQMHTRSADSLRETSRGQLPDHTRRVMLGSILWWKAHPSIFKLYICDQGDRSAIPEACVTNTLQFSAHAWCRSRGLLGKLRNVDIRICLFLI